MTVARIAGGGIAAVIGVIALALAVFAAGATIWTIAGIVTGSHLTQILATAGFVVILALEAVAGVLAGLTE